MVSEIVSKSDVLVIGGSIAGIFAAGDVTNVPEKQIIIAAGEGSKAALSVFHYLSKNNF